MGRSIECPDCGMHLWVTDEVEARLTKCDKCGLKVKFVAPGGASAKPQPTPEDTGTIGSVDELMEGVLGEKTEVGSGTGIDDMVDAWTLTDDSGIMALGAADIGDSSGIEIDDVPSPNDSGVAEAIAPTPSVEKPAPAAPPAPKPAPAIKKTEPVAPRPTAVISTEVDVNVRPEDIRLRIREIDGGDVVLEFPSQLLYLPTFRASMPMCCISSLESDPGLLMARPFAWVDRLKGQIMTCREFSDRFATEVKRGMNERQFVDQLNPIESLQPPFNMPMPYYVAKDCDREVEIICRVVNTEYGVGCEVRLPIGPATLDWVARVNGICGSEYEQLEAIVMRLQSHEWRSMPEKLRQRLSSWFDWGGDERFLIYLPDSDFSRKDDGLAGIALTDKRLVYRKYTKQGVLLFNQPGRLVFSRDGMFCNLAYVSEHGSAEDGCA